MVSFVLSGSREHLTPHLAPCIDLAAGNTPIRCDSHSRHLPLTLLLKRAHTHTHARTDRDINTSCGVLNVGFSRCSLPGCKVTLASFISESGNRNVQNGSGVVPRLALGLPWLAVRPGECAFLMLPWPRWERWLGGLIVAAGPNGNRMERDREGDGKGVFFCWI